jgi:septal ring factor EnvC (AmiA/AmiB activator)
MTEGQGLWTIILTALLSSGTIAAVLQFISARKSTRTTYMDTVAKTLASDYERLKKDLEGVRDDLRAERQARRELEKELEAEREIRRRLERDLRLEKEKTQDLEARVASLEQEER